LFSYKVSIEEEEEEFSEHKIILVPNEIMYTPFETKTFPCHYLFFILDFFSQVENFSLKNNLIRTQILKKR